MTQNPMMIKQLFSAICEKRNEVVKTMIQNDPGLVTCRNSCVETPLHEAVLRGNKQAVALLLEQGADPQAPDLNQVTPLSLARGFERADICKMLEEFPRKKAEAETKTLHAQNIDRLDRILAQRKGHRP